MHFHYYTLQHIAHFLNEKMKGGEVWDCFSQNKNELIIESSQRVLRIGCHTPLTYIVPIKDFKKARKNVVNLFPELLGLQFKTARVVPYDRILVLAFTGGYELILKMHSIQANILLRKDGKVLKMFNNAQDQDQTFVEEAGRYSPENITDTPCEDEKAVLDKFREIAPIFEKQYAKKVFSLIESGNSFSEAYQQVVRVSENDTFYLRKEKDRIRFLPFEPAPDSYPHSVIVKIEGIATALRVFYRAAMQYTNYLRQYNGQVKVARKPYDKLRKVHNSYQKSVQKIENERSSEEVGHIIMANLHAIEKGEKSVELFDFYTNENIKVKLKPNLSAQENAALYYEKHKGRKGKISHLRKELADIAKKMKVEEEKLKGFETLIPPAELSFTASGFDYEQLKHMRRFMKDNEKEQEVQEEKTPFRSFLFEGYEIFVGKNAKNNDELTLHFAHKNDTWLHARDVSGSHVVIRHKAGQNIPEVVLEYAAGLAAWFSKRKNDSLVPVIYTSRKYVRKRKGLPPGKVVVEREQVLMIEPNDGRK